MKLIKETIAPLYTRMRYFSRAQYNGLALFKTIWFNMRALPWRQARKLPIFIYRGTKVYHCGTFKITAEHVVCGMIQIGKLGYKAPGNGRIANYGIIEFKAPRFLGVGLSSKIGDIFCSTAKPKSAKVLRCSYGTDSRSGNIPVSGFFRFSWIATTILR